jgi:hypothetical protein
MHSIAGRLILWVSAILDRSLLTVPDVDELHPPSTDGEPPITGRGDQQIEWTQRPRRALLNAREVSKREGSGQL